MHIPVHPTTSAQLEQLRHNPPHAVLLIGAPGVGKRSLAEELAASLLEIELNTLSNHAGVQLLDGQNGAITIDMVRDVQHFLSRKSTSSASTNRIVLLHQADKMTLDAQNAFLKTLEEPPTAAVLIVTVSDANTLLPTVRSRLQAVTVHAPALEDVQQYFAEQDHSAADIQKAMMMSGGLPGLMQELLSGDSSHPLIAAAETARNILRLDTFGRLALIDSLSKQRETCRNVCFMLQQMSGVVLRDSTRKPAAVKQWNTIMQQSYAAEQALATQASTKLVLTNLMLSI
jgi:replication-associated recombination protein RarA